jgi:triacylglycerol lipase
MPFTNTSAAAYGLLAMHAMDMYRAQPGSPTPPPAAGLVASGWNVVGYVVGTDTALPRGVPGPLRMAAQTVCYGFAARNAAGEPVVAIRGTDGFVEWIEDAEFVPIPYAPATALPAGGPAITVERGFWGIYASLRLVDPSGAALGVLAPAVGQLAGAAGPVTIVGHSLGSALATYLTLDLGRAVLGARVSACLFASPHPGNQGFAALFGHTVADYRLFNYILDIVPRVPPAGLGYAALPRRTVLRPSTAEAAIRFDIACNHHVICYCAMLDYDGTNKATTPVPPGEEDSKPCILGPETGASSVAKEFLSFLAGAMPV